MDQENFSVQLRLRLRPLFSISFLFKLGATTAVVAFSVIIYIDSVVGMFICGMCEGLQPGHQPLSWGGALREGEGSFQIYGRLRDYHVCCITSFHTVCG